MLVNFSLSGTETTVSGAEDSIETNEAAAALLNMESPNNILDEKRMSKSICIVDLPQSHNWCRIFNFLLSHKSNLQR